MKFYTFLIGIFFLIITPNLATAQSTTKPTPTPIVPKSQPTTGIDLTVSPVFLNLTTDPGKNVSTSIKVQNNNNETEYLKLTLSKFSPVADGNPAIADLDKGDEFSKWISYSPSEFVLLPNETKTIKVSITPPTSAALGYYYAIVVSRIKEADDTSQPVVSGSPAIPVILEVRSPNAKREVQLVDFTTDSPFYEYLPTTFKINIKNSGNIHVPPIGDIFIDWGDTKDVGVIQVNAGKGNVLPQSSRVFSASWEDGIFTKIPKVVDGREVKDKDGKTVYETKIDFNKPLSKFRIGKYTANLLLIYDNGERDIPLQAKVSFWIIPWKMILMVIGIAIAPFLIYSIIRKIRGGKR